MARPDAHRASLRAAERRANEWGLAVRLPLALWFVISPEDSQNMSDERGSGPITSTQRAQRNARIAMARAEGQAWAQIAASEGLGVRQCARAVREHVEASVPAAVADPLDLAAFVIQTHLDSLTALARLSRSKNAPTALGAAARAPAIALSLLDVSERVGLAPGPIGSWSFLRDLPAIVTAFMVAADRAGVPADLVLRELGVAVEEADAPELQLAGAGSLKPTMEDT